MSTAPALTRGPVPGWVKVLAVAVAALTLLFAGSLALGMIAVVDGTSVSRGTSFSAEVPSGATVTVDSRAGAVRVTNSADGRMHVVDRADGRTLTRALAELALSQVRFARLDAGAGGVTVTVPNGGPPILGSYSRLVTVSVPAGVSLVIHARAAAIDLDGVRGDVDVDAGAAGVALRDVTVDRTVRVRAGSGAISVQGVMAGGALDLSTNTGAVAVTVPPGTDATYDLATSVGGVSVRTGSPVSRQAGGLHAALTGALGDGSQGTIRARSTTGAIVLQVR